MRLTEALARVTPRRVHGISAVLLPYTDEGEIAWDSFRNHVARTRAAGLEVAVNMDTGFGDLLSVEERDRVLDATCEVVAGSRFYASAFSAGTDLVVGYHASIAAVLARGGTPIIVQHPAMHSMAADQKARCYERAVAPCDEALAFELGPVFAPHGEIWDDETFLRLLDIPAIVGAKHSSLDRETELRRLATRDERRPDFRVYTGNDLAIDMVLYGSDYLLGLSTFAPAAFAARDRALAGDDIAFLAINDALQHLGNVGFRAPVPAYKHSAAIVLHHLGLIATDAVHPAAPRRPAGDRAVLVECMERVAAAVGDR